jgi:hypothetical protein
MTAKQEREARLAAQLRENLKRRKAAAREGPSSEGETEPTANARHPGLEPGSR